MSARRSDVVVGFVSSIDADAVETDFVVVVSIAVVRSTTIGVIIKSGRNRNDDGFVVSVVVSSAVTVVELPVLTVAVSLVVVPTSTGIGCC